MTQWCLLFYFLVVGSKLTKVGALHEVVSGVFGVTFLHQTWDGVESGEVVSMETVVMFQPA